MPERPTNPRIVHDDGTVTPVELAYDGTDDDGTHQWVSMTPIRPHDRFAVDTLPGQTSIGFPIVLPEGDDHA